MEVEKLNYNEVMKEVGAGPTEQELAMVPTSQRELFKEVRRGNNLQEWTVRHLIRVNNIVVEHEKQLGPMRVMAKFVVWVFGALSGIAIAWAWFKAQVTGK